MQNKLFSNEFPGVSFPSATEITKIDVEELISLVKKTKKKDRFRPIIFNPDCTDDQLRVYYNKPEEPIDDRKCSLPWSTARINEDGTVISCPRGMALDYVLGNIKEASLSEIWIGDRARRLREVLAQKKENFPICVRCCGQFKSYG